MKQRILAAAILLAALLAFSSCGGNSPAESSQPTSSEASLPTESSADSSESSPESSEEAAVRWGGTYASENDGILSIEMMDSNSFEFTLSVGDDILESLVARITGPGQAAYTGADGTRLSFAYEDGVIRITAEDSTGAEFEGEYSSD